MSCSGEQSDVDDESYRSEQNNLKGTSRFLKEIETDKEKHRQVEPPTTPPLFRWNFSNKDVHAYAYEQEVRSKAAMSSPPDDRINDMQPELSGRGLLLVKSQGDGTANLVLKDLKMSMKTDFGGNKESDTMEHTAPPLVVQGMKEDGSGSFGESSQEMFLKSLFPLPTKPLKVGESVDVPAQMPFNAMGSVLQVKGRSRITLGRYVKIGNRTCAQLDVDLDVSEMKVPSELKGKYKCSIKGTSVFYFDVANRFFTSGSIALLMQFSIDAPMPRWSKTSETEAPEIPKRQKMSMINDNLIRVNLKE